MSSNKKRRELNRATEEHNRARVSAELAGGMVDLKCLAETVMGQRIVQLEAQLAAIQKATKVLVLDSDEMDFDEYTAMCVPMDVYNDLIEAVSATEQMEV